MEGMLSNGMACCKTTLTNNDPCTQSLVFAFSWEAALWKARHNEETPESRSQASFPGRIANICPQTLRWTQGDVKEDAKISVGLDGSSGGGNYRAPSGANNCSLNLMMMVGVCIPYHP